MPRGSTSSSPCRRARTSPTCRRTTTRRSPGQNFNWLQDSFWQQALAAPDQLRQRVKFALSQILVVSAENGTIASLADSHASYVDLLGEHAFGNYRQLLEAVATHPAMGIYLSHLRNRKGDPVTGRVPDENFAREVMQLFSIGLLELNQDGTPRLVNGAPVETYTNADTSGIARVFTGWSWAAPTTTDQAFNGSTTATYPDRNVRPMQPYPQFHETGAKTFLGVTIPPNTSAQASMKIAMDTLFNHPNLCPFIGRQLVQRLVTSNPSPAYVGRVAAACANNGSGVRGDMKAIIRAILLDAEARDAAKITDPQWGKVREPVLRLSNWARCFNATSASGNWTIRGLDSPSTSLGQQPLRPPSVFNFYRPGYTPPNTAIATAGLVAPEFQIVGETSVVGYVNFMQGVIVHRRGGRGQRRARRARELRRGAGHRRRRGRAPRPHRPLPHQRLDAVRDAAGDPERRERDQRDHHDRTRQPRPHGHPADDGIPRVPGAEVRRRP